ncbi:MAG: hypothetical protein E7159_02555 [Firmicutes bacterium]|nr:hypothetical protein [Bacillota bacterium]
MQELSEKAIKGLTAYHRFIEDAGYVFSSYEYNDGYVSGNRYTISGNNFRFELESFWNKNMYPDLTKHYRANMEYKGKEVTYDEYHYDYVIYGKSSSGEEYNFNDFQIRDDFGNPIFKKEAGLDDFFVSEDGIVSYNIEQDKVYLGINRKFEIDYNKDIAEQVDEYINDHYPTKYIRNYITGAVRKLADEYDYKLGNIDSVLDYIIGEFQVPVTDDNKYLVIWAIENIKEYYQLFLECVECRQEAGEIICKINQVLEGISDTVDDEYRKIPGSHVLTEEERNLVTERSRIRIRENKELANKNSRF